MTTNLANAANHFAAIDMAEHEMAWSGLIEIAEGHDLLVRVRDAFLQFVHDFAGEIDSDPILRGSYMEMAVILQGKIQRAAPMSAPEEKKE